MSKYGGNSSGVLIVLIIALLVLGIGQGIVHMANSTQTMEEPK